MGFDENLHVNSGDHTDDRAIVASTGDLAASVIIPSPCRNLLCWRTPASVPAVHGFRNEGAAPLVLVGFFPDAHFRVQVIADDPRGAKFAPPPDATQS